MIENSNKLEPSFRQPIPFLFLVVAISVGPFILNQIGFDFGSAKIPFQVETTVGMISIEITDSMFRALGGAFLHTILEWSAFSAAIFTVILFFANFTTNRDMDAPILGVAFFCAGCMDAFHTLAADRLIEAVADNRNLVPFTWAICRLFNALILIGSVALLIYGGNKGRPRNLWFVVLASLVFGFTAYGIIQVCATSASLPNTMFPDALITRPWDVAPLALYLFAGFYVFPIFHKREKNFISYSILISVIPHVATQLHMAFGSFSLYDNHFNVAHFLKIMAYLVPFVGLSLEYIKTYRDQQISETRSHTITESAQEGIVVINPNGLVTDFNPFAEKMFGYTAKEVLGNNVKMLMPEPYNSEHDGYLLKYLRTHQKNIIDTVREVEGLRKDSTTFPMELRVSEMNLGGKPFFGGSLRDISERKASEEKVEKAKKQAENAQAEAESANKALIQHLEDKRFLASIVENTDDVVIGKNLTGEIVSWNRGAEIIYGYTSEEIVGQNISILIPEDRKYESDSFLKEIKEGKKIKHFETIRIRKDKTAIDVSLTISPIKNILGEIIGASTIARDITQWKEAQNVLVSTKEEAEAANRAKSNFLANMSHEIRTPMNAILGYSQILLRRRDLEPSQRQALETIDTSGKNLLDMINEILDISKIEAGRMDLQEINFDLNDLTNGISKMFELRCQQKQLDWRVDGLKEPCLVSGDEHKLRAILTNLIGNAVKFTDSGEVVFKITPLEDEWFLFEVVDTGSGISVKDQQHIFEPFYQEDSGAKKGGTGLGLAISNKQLELMGSRLEVQSELGKGSCFHFTLFLPKAVGEIPKRSERTQNILYLAEGHKVKALIVDDVKDNRDVLAAFLSQLKIDVIEAVDGQDGLEKVREHLPDIIFMDIRMPVMNGRESIAAIQKEFGEDRFKIVVITASVFGRDIEPYAQFGVQEFIAKPFRVEHIIQCLQDLLDIEFEYADKELPKQESPSSAEIDYSNISLSEDLYLQLKDAVELSSITELERIISKLQTMDENCAQLAAQIKESLNKFDMSSIKEIFEKINHGKN